MLKRTHIQKCIQWCEKNQIPHNKFIDKVNRIIDGGKINEFIIFTSADAWGAQAEYIRNGLEFNRFWGNVNKILTKYQHNKKTLKNNYETKYNNLSDSIKCKLDLIKLNEVYPFLRFLPFLLI